MKSNGLALLGGEPLVGELKKYRSIGSAEQAAVRQVLDSQCLSGFYGSPGPEFLGGPWVRKFEEAWAKRFEIEYAISVNSNTSGLIAAMGAIGLSPGEEVIVPAWSMSATAIAPLFYGGIPVFVDIEPETFCINVEQVESEINNRTRAIIVTNLFGHPAELAKLRSVADKRGIYLVEDNAQAPLGSEGGLSCGTIGHIGVFSLNYHKHIHTGEGGMCVTNDPDLAKRLQLIRNHGENMVETEGFDDISNLIGMNLRLTEMSAAVGCVQLENIDGHVEKRERLAANLSEQTRGIAGFTPPVVRKDCRHNYYCWVAKYDEEAMEVPLAVFSEALTAEGFPHSTGYLPPLYLLPVFQRRSAIGRAGFPFSLSDREYAKGLCPNTEYLHDNRVLLFEPCAWDISDSECNLLAEAVKKVVSHVGDLSGHD